MTVRFAGWSAALRCGQAGSHFPRLTFASAPSLEILHRCLAAAPLEDVNGILALGSDADVDSVLSGYVIQRPPWLLSRSSFPGG